MEIQMVHNKVKTLSPKVLSSKQDLEIHVEVDSDTFVNEIMEINEDIQWSVSNFILIVFLNAIKMCFLKSLQ